MDFFAFTNDGTSTGCYRLQIENGIQDDLSAKFLQMGGSLTSPQLVSVKFERDNFKPDETEVLRIEGFDLPAHIFEAFASPIDCPAFPMNDEAISTVYGLCAYDAGHDIAYIQVVKREQRLCQSTLRLIVSGEVFNRLHAAGLTIGSTCHAVYQQGVLLFQSIYWMKQIFDISSYYREATDVDIDAFVALKSVIVEDSDALKKRAGQWVRSRVAYILDSGILTEMPVSKIAETAKQFDLTLNIQANDKGDECLVIPADSKQLRELLKFLEEELYVGPLTGGSFEANSKRARS